MIIRHYLYNTFLIEDGHTKIAIDPGQSLYWLDFKSLIPKQEWASITHVLVTHGDPDHYWQADRLALAANAPLILNRTMVKEKDGKTLILAPRKGGLNFLPFNGEIHAMDTGEVLSLGRINIEAISTQHGPIQFKILGLEQRKIPGPKERAGFGSIGYKIKIGQFTIVNVGDCLIREEWAGLAPDVAMLPIGGLGNNTWTMDAADALAAVQSMSPGLVIPCHYNVPFLWSKKMALANDQAFRREVEKLGIKCQILRAGDEIIL